ncbi:RNA-directed DNA polymerase, eukaryota, nucleotide-binding alpha-beta plait domain protein [Tanacetum coccineum]|uniref:RNA-directed DNA polymerase, eukaryota, nucleotide-binding alpha-beta plait domain protein n=1 Tax=Tanacetum coccineum TaxID=301880 RepID=A0ABQ4Y0N2_9ASTR
MGGDVDINTLTTQQYLALIQNNIRPGMVKPEIGDDFEFEINRNFMRELRRKLFKGTDDEDTHEHVRRVLEIAYLFHFPGVTHDAVMLRVFPITLTGPALRWNNRLSEGLIITWDLLEKGFIRKYYPPFKTAKKLEEICNFKQEMDETLYHAWERYSDLLYKCLQHDLNSQQKIQIFYTGLDIPTRITLDSKATTKESIKDSPDNVDTNKLKENIHAIQVSCKICEGEHQTKECPLKKDDKSVESSKYIGSLEETIIKYCNESIKKQGVNDEWIRKFIENTDLNLRAFDTTTKNLQVKADQLTKMVLTNAGEKVKAKLKMSKKDMKEPVPRDLLVV